MFTGIITALGHIVEAKNLGDSAAHGKRLCIQTPPGYLADVAPGDSIALNGACMTVTSLDLDHHRFTVDISAESLQKTTGLDAVGGASVESVQPHALLNTPSHAPLNAPRNAGDEPGVAINLEKALRVGDRLGGHIVSGHVDGLGQVSHWAPVGESWTLRLLIPRELAKYLAYKGSITVHGVSLTVNRVEDLSASHPLAERFGCEIDINLIPHTLEHTALRQLRAGHAVNLEVDTLARYCERMLNQPGLAPN